MAIFTFFFGQAIFADFVSALVVPVKRLLSDFCTIQEEKKTLPFCYKRRQSKEALIHSVSSCHVIVFT